MRQTSLWYDKKLSPHEIEVFFGMLDQSHQKIIEEIRLMVNDFASDNIYGRDPIAEKDQPSNDASSDDDSSEI